MNVQELIVSVQNPEILDQTVQQFGSVVVQDARSDYSKKDGNYVVRCFGNADFVKFAIENQGYGKVVSGPHSIDKIQST